MSGWKGAQLCILFTTILGSYAEIPSYIHVCHRNDPNIDKCIMNSVEALRPLLKKGIPELDVPPLEPLKIPEIVISRGGGGGTFRAVGSDIVVHGASNFELEEIKSDIDNLIFLVNLRIPELFFEANYDVNAKILNLNIKGKGPIQANTTDVGGTAILKGSLQKNEKGKNYVHIQDIDLKLKMKNYSVKLENLFNGDKALGEAINVALNENKKELMQMLRPQAEKTVSNVLLDIANKITTHFEYEELFPIA